MDCRTARFLLDFQRPDDGELPPEEVVELERHLAGCADCDAAGRAERRFDQHLAPVVNDVPVPEGLKERLLDRLRDARGAVLRRRLAWTARGVAVAAAILVGVLLWLHYRVVPPPELDLTEIAKISAEQKEARSPEKVQELFQTQHQVAMVAPVKFNYDHLIDSHLVELQGKPVPKLAFAANDGTWADVYVIRGDQFDTKDIIPGRSGTFNQNVDIDRLEDDPHHTIYVIVWGGAASLDSLKAAAEGN